MTAGTNIEQRSVILVPFPFTDLSGAKKRPALVISSTEFNRKNEDIICCLITSNLEDTHHSININNKDMEDGFLEFESKIKSYRMFTVHKKLVYKQLGKLNSIKSKLAVSELKEIIEVQ